MVISSKTMTTEQSAMALNVTTVKFKEVAHKADAVRHVIGDCLRERVYAHPTLLKSVQANVDVLQKMVDLVHSNIDYNIMMCVAETIDKHIAGAEHGKTIMADTVSRYFESNVPHLFNEDNMVVKLTQLLKYHKAKQSVNHHGAMNIQLMKYGNTLEFISDSCWFLGNLRNHSSLHSMDINNEIFNSIANSMLKLSEESPAVI